MMMVYDLNGLMMSKEDEEDDEKWSQIVIVYS